MTEATRETSLGTDEVDAAVSQVFGLYEDFGEADYLGEAVTQVQHALQAAHLAEEEGFPVQVVLGALLHDVGHLAGQREGQQIPRMVTQGVTLGVAQHEVLGEEYLKDLGFPSDVTHFVRSHVEAKRFLVASDSNYYQGLSDASKKTLEHQGGPMTQAEMESFKAHPQFKSSLRMREWDDKAKDPTAVTPTLDYYRQMCYDYLLQRNR
ncbi:hypothetical protein Pcinc_036747 [Petrolisthes cinctipes]|uniref:HD domain-containing protein n=1 Tax=Petrolisthes cinctipes TaxID=88211 RepID=A0AAE1BQ04_PETCI|nr:hypothetical protein Pcinc_038919 [Petrolisthes cinctipes]KAK3856973.1 hypothetical protein Pcinc_036747 [Petrolisthes cinctipes]